MAAEQGKDPKEVYAQMSSKSLTLLFQYYMWKRNTEHEFLAKVWGAKK